MLILAQMPQHPGLVAAYGYDVSSSCSRKFFIPFLAVR